MRTLVVLFALVSFTAIGCNSYEEPTAPPSAGKSGQLQAADNDNRAEQYKDIPVSFSGFIPCCEEYVQMTGTCHYVVRKNGYHFNFTGMSGSGYTQVGGTVVNSFTSENGYSYSYRIRFENEQGCGFTLVVHIRLQENANGEVTVDIDKYEIDCEND